VPLFADSSEDESGSGSDSRDETDEGGAALTADGGLRIGTHVGLRLKTKDTTKWSEFFLVTYAAQKLYRLGAVKVSASSVPTDGKVGVTGRTDRLRRSGSSDSRCRRQHLRLQLTIRCRFLGRGCRLAKAL